MASTRTVVPLAEAELEERHAEVLAEVPVLRIATLSPRGDPFIYPVPFHFDGEVLYFAAPAGSETMIHLRANRRIALLADRGDPGAREGFVLQGLVQAVRSDREASAVWEALREKYANLPEAEVQGTLMKVSPVRVVAFGGKA